MRAKKYYEQGELIFSSVFGNGVYRPINQVVPDPLGRFDGYSSLLENVMTHELFFMRRLNCPPQTYGRFWQKVLRPPLRQHILWPSDVVALPHESYRLDCNMFVANRYTAEEEEDTSPGASVALFGYGAYPPMVDGLQKLSTLYPCNWKNPAVREMAFQILLAIDELNRCGYVYEDFHLSRFFFLENGQVYLDFSNLIYDFAELSSGDWTTACAVKEKEYPLEFADPAIVTGLFPALDMEAQNYSLCAMLFFLFFGRYAYDGRLLTGYADTSLQNHYVKFSYYHKMPIFIFDPEDTQNSLGAFAEEQEVIALWEECPQPIKELFLSTLRQDNAQRKGRVSNPGPKVWLDRFVDVGWLVRGNQGG